ncbi:MAG: hypothetical protein R3F44_08715 [Candidatus Competibacteraceae bacterium]
MAPTALSHRCGNRPFLINLQTRNDQADTALQVAQTTLRQFSAAGPDPQMLEEARQNITAVFISTSPVTAS